MLFWALLQRWLLLSHLACLCGCSSSIGEAIRAQRHRHRSLLAIGGANQLPVGASDIASPSRQFQKTWLRRCLVDCLPPQCQEGHKLATAAGPSHRVHHRGPLCCAGPSLLPCLDRRRSGHPRHQSPAPGGKRSAGRRCYPQPAAQVRVSPLRCQRWYFPAAIFRVAMKNPASTRTADHLRRCLCQRPPPRKRKSRLT